MVLGGSLHWIFHLLDQHKINVSEVGYMVGFVDIRYFRQCFKHKFGLSPREYTQQKADKEQ
ncbi:AraC family transcriptional regulator [Alistipes senegalensis]|uniref:AraC family transcriptional regulator n=1 Tax=Alistipes senegalensis TaxID=1288121 RepID=UPI0039775F20|nr:AraC family transcriptional regulator [Clostridia bacterium]